ncbi:MAG: amidohydrolase family protein [Proteobacteria bacterium]|nr:amidohydrolase family protein [Pseudomonadota bacterium]
MSGSGAGRVDAIRARLDHPVIDSDAHFIEFMPEVLDRLRELAGERAVAAFERLGESIRASRALTPRERRQAGGTRAPWWAFPTSNTLDRATMMLPRLLYERLDEIGLDFAVVYPSYATFPVNMGDAELRQAGCRAFNRHIAEAFRDYRDRLAPVATIPMHTPEEAVAELEYAVRELGFRAVVLPSYVRRPYAGAGSAPGASWIDFFCFESPHDFDPVWAACERLGVAPTFHSTGYGWGSRTSTSNYVANHIGNFAAAGEGIARSLFLSGVPWRFPGLRFAFLEGGVNWACSLYADLIGHWAKRNREQIHSYDPARLDRPLLEELIGRYGSESVRERLGELDRSLYLLSDPDEDPESLDEFSRCGIESPEDIRDVFAERFHFGCEADDPMNASAFSTRLPLGARLKAIFSSDIGHWDVPDMSKVLTEAYELVDEGHLSEGDFREFAFDNPMSLWWGANSEFFHGTALESAVPAAAETARPADPPPAPA